jgi:hypothetical protein
VISIVHPQGRLTLCWALAPLDGTDFALRFSPGTDSCKRRGASFHYRVNLEMVGVPPIARSMATTKSVLGTSAWMQRLGTKTASRVDLSSFRITT